MGDLHFIKNEPLDAWANLNYDAANLEYTKSFHAEKIVRNNETQLPQYDFPQYELPEVQNNIAQVQYVTSTSQVALANLEETSLESPCLDIHTRGCASTLAFCGHQNDPFLACVPNQNIIFDVLQPNLWKFNRLNVELKYLVDQNNSDPLNFSFDDRCACGKEGNFLHIEDLKLRKTATIENAGTHYNIYK